MKGLFISTIIANALGRVTHSTGGPVETECAQIHLRNAAHKKGRWSIDVTDDQGKPIAEIPSGSNITITISAKTGSAIS